MLAPWVAPMYGKDLLGGGPGTRREFEGTDPCVHSSYVYAEQKIQTQGG